MTETNANPSPLSALSLGRIAATRPGATAVFRRHKLDFCCGGAARLGDAVAAAGLSLEAIEAELAALTATAEAAPDESDALIAHILERYHAVHRRELPELIALADTVEDRHAGHDEVPAGLAALLREVAANMESHLGKEEQILFPLMLRGGHPMIGQPITVMRHEHDSHGENLHRIETLTHGFQPPSDACDGWKALYAGLAKFADDLMMHIHLENNVLFPRFGA